MFLSFPLRAGSPLPLYEPYPLSFPLVYSAVLLELSHVQVSKGVTLNVPLSVSPGRVVRMPLWGLSGKPRYALGTSRCSEMLGYLLLVLPSPNLGHRRRQSESRLPIF